MIRELLVRMDIEMSLGYLRGKRQGRTLIVGVESARGSLELKAHPTPDIHPKVVAMQHGWSESNANLLTDDELRDPISGYPAYRSVPCRVRKAG